MIEITLKRSLIGSNKRQKETAKALGITKIGRSVVRPNNAAVQGMIRKLEHLVEVKEVK